VTRALVAVTALAVLALLAVPAVAATADDQQRAKVGVLRLTDFPTGWKQSARGAGSDAKVDAAAAKIKRCTTFVEFAARNKKNPRAESPNFDLGQANVTNTVSVYPTVTRAEGAIGLFRDAKLPRCLEQLFDAVTRAELQKDKSVRKQLKSVTTDVGRVTGIRIGDDAVVYQGTVVVGLKNGTSQTFGLGFVTVRVGTALAGFAYTADQDISAALQPAIVASVTRLQRAAPSP
jgi:hypothetical protein